MITNLKNKSKKLRSDIDELQSSKNQFIQEFNKEKEETRQMIATMEEVIERVSFIQFTGLLSLLNFHLPSLKAKTRVTRNGIR